MTCTCTVVNASMVAKISLKLNAGVQGDLCMYSCGRQAITGVRLAHQSSAFCWCMGLASGSVQVGVVPRNVIICTISATINCLVRHRSWGTSSKKEASVIYVYIVVWNLAIKVTLHISLCRLLSINVTLYTSLCRLLSINVTLKTSLYRLIGSKATLYSSLCWLLTYCFILWHDTVYTVVSTVQH